MLHLKKNSLKIRNAFVLILSAVIYFILLIFLSKCSLSESSFNIGSNSVKVYSLCGVLSSLQMLASLCAVVICKRTGFVQFVIIYMLSFMHLIAQIIFKNNWMALPGVLTTFAGLVTICVIWRYLRDINKNKTIINEITETDALTNLPNRQCLNMLMNRLADSGTPFALAIIDIDNFKSINDTMGHDYGDELLKEITRRWNGVKRDQDCLSRLGGDEFAFIITDFTDKANISARGERYMYCFKEKFTINGKNFYPTASMGIALYPDDSNEPMELMKCADTALYIAKQQGKHRISYFKSSQREDVMADMEAENILRRVISEESFQIFYQPQYDLHSGSLRGFEALLRISDNGELVPPKKYIELAEKLNIVSDIDRWVIKNALAEFKSAFDIEPALKLSLNLTPEFMLDELFLSTLKENLRKNKIDAHNVEIEINEKLITSYLNKAKELINELHNIGVSVAIDDFGSSGILKHLGDISADTIKIGCGYTAAIGNSDSRTKFIKGIISMGHALGSKIVTVGVETEQQKELLKDFDNDFIQGFLVEKPVDIKKAIDIIYDDACK